MGGSAGALPFSVVVGLRALVLIGQCLSSVKCEISSQFTPLLMLCGQGLPVPAVQYRGPHRWSLVWWEFSRYLQDARDLQCPP